MEDIVKIIQYFAELSSKVKLSNQLNLIDVNIQCENKILLILNCLYGWELRNINTVSSNAPAIDLVDEVRRVAIQVTSDTSSSKVKKTIQKLHQTHFSDYDLYMFYLCDEIPQATKKAIQRHNIQCLCFSDVVKMFNSNPIKARQFLIQYVQQTTREKFAELLMDRDKWSFDCNLNLYYSDIDPSFRIKLEKCDGENKQYAWIEEIKAISKYYEAHSMYYNFVRLLHNDIELFFTISATFYGEGLTITLPHCLFFDYMRDLYFDGYCVYSDDNNVEYNLNSLLVYFFNHKQLAYEKFVKSYRILTYEKASYEWVPLIFFANRQEFKKFEEFVQGCVDNFNYDDLRSSMYSLDSQIKDKRAHRNCCFHFWIYDLYWNNFSENLYIL